MEKIMSVEEKIRRAEEIYARRQEGTKIRTAKVNVNNENRKDVKLLKKMIMQMFLSLLIYIVIYVIQNNNYIFSEDFLNRVNEILSYDMNFVEIYENMRKNMELSIEQLKNNGNKDMEEEIQNNSNENTEEETNKGEDAIGGAIENNDGVTITKQNIEQSAQENVSVEKLTQEEQDIENIKAATTFIKPVEGKISSRFGQREPTTSTVPKNHTGTDIAANMGTKIFASTGGEVVLASEEGDYGKHLKIQIGDVSIIYAHCNNLYVKQGDIISQGQEIAEVGSTGNSTGPHLHFEVRISERIVDPEKILEL